MNNDLDKAANNKRIVLVMYEAAIRGDAETVMSVLDEGIVCYESPALPYGGVYKGHEGILALFDPLARYLAIEQIKIDHLIADAEWVVASIRLPIRSSGCEILVSEHHRIHDGKVMEQRIFFFDPTAIR